MWRLSTISAHVFPLSPPSAAEAANLVSTAAEVTRRPLYLTEQITLPRQLEQDDSGALLPADVAMLERLEAQAVARREYRLAAHLRDMLTALVPQQQAFGRASGLPRRTLEDFAPPDGDPAIALRCFRTHGFVVLHGLLHGAALQRARDAWRRAEPSCHAEYEQREAAVASGGNNSDIGSRFVYNIPNLMELDDVFIDLADHPKLVAVVQHVGGAGGLGLSTGVSAHDIDRRYHGTMRIAGSMSGNIVQSQLSDGTVNSEGYTMWHHDHPTPTDQFLPSHRTTKVFVALWDIPLDGGCTALVPGTHRLPGCFLPGSQSGMKVPKLRISLPNRTLTDNALHSELLTTHS